MVYEIGSFIHDLRVERGYSQEELCYGICSTGNLSKIENGIRMPNRKTIEALMQRLGCEDVFLQFSSREEMYQVEICEKIVGKLAERDFDGLEELVEEFEASISEGDVLNSQYCRFTKAMISQAKGAQAETVIRELEEALQMTKPGYMKEGFKVKGLLTYNEITILTNIANNYAKNDNDKAMKILFALKDYMDNHVLDGNERVKKYQIIIHNLSEQRYLYLQLIDHFTFCYTLLKPLFYVIKLNKNYSHLANLQLNFLRYDKYCQEAIGHCAI